MWDRVALPPPQHQGPSRGWGQSSHALCTCKIPPQSPRRVWPSCAASHAPLCPSQWAPMGIAPIRGSTPRVTPPGMIWTITSQSGSDAHARANGKAHGGFNILTICTNWNHVVDAVMDGQRGMLDGRHKEVVASDNDNPHPWSAHHAHMAL